eukprot:gene3581-210_t
MVPPLGWADPIMPVGRDHHGGVWDFWLSDPSLPVNFIFHLGDVKSVDEDQSWVPSGGMEVWLTKGSTDIIPYDPVVGPK